MARYESQSTSRGLQNLNGGLNSTGNALGIQDSEASDLLNVDFDLFGSVKKRKGYSTLNSSEVNSGATCTGLYWAQFKSADLLVANFEDKFYKMDDLDGTFDQVTISGTTITAGANLLMDYTLFTDTLIFTNGNDAPIKWTGTGNAVAADVPTGLTKAKFVTHWHNYAFYFNVTVSGVSRPSRGYWSTIKDLTSWVSTKFIDVDIEDGQEITGVRPLGDRLVIFKERSIHFWLFTGDSDIPFISVRSPSDVGCISGYSIQEVDNGLIFRASDGYYFFDGNDSVKASDRITKTLNGYEDNRKQYINSCYQRSKNRYISSETTSGGTTHDRNVVFDSANNAWGIYSGLKANVFANVTTGGEERIYFGDYAGFVYQADNGANDNPLGVETAIEAYWKSKWFNFGDLYLEKSITHIFLYYEISPSILTIGHSYDLDDSDQYRKTEYLGTSAAVYGSAVYDEDLYAVEGGGITRVDLVGRGRLVRLAFYNNTIDEDFQINGIGFDLAVETTT